MKVNNETIVITDPCYLFDKSDYRYGGYNDRLCNYGFFDYIKEPTLYGDWDCTTFKTINKKINSIEDLKLYVENVANNNLNNSNDEVIGNFTSDGGEVCIVKRNNILSFNKNFEINEYYHGSYFDENGKFIQGVKKIESIYNRLATIINNFDGEVCTHDFYIEDTEHRVIIGFGNIKFYTLQTDF